MMKYNYTPSPLPEVAELSTLPHTDFVPTLEHPFAPAEKKNIIYSPTLLYAWEELVQQVGTVVVSEHHSQDFRLLATSGSHANSLNAQEYSIKVSVNGLELKVEAFFHKSLGFPKKLMRSEKPLRFRQSDVAAFGKEQNDSTIFSFVDIAYYENDQHFVLRLSPKEREHEILLAKGIGDISTLHDAVEEISNRIEQGQQERKKAEETWKYKLLSDDTLLIPVIAFHLEANYAKIEGQEFNTAGNTPYCIIVAKQRTAVVLNENGAEVRSEAILFAVGGRLPSPPQAPHPKHLVFDQSFYLIMKRREQRNPYLVVKVENAEILSPVSAQGNVAKQ